MLKYCKALKFEEDPNYSYIKEILKQAFIRGQFEYDLMFDWTSHSAALEKKSTFHHVADHQHQLAHEKPTPKGSPANININASANGW